MRFYFNEDNREPTCVLCGNKNFYNLSFCEECGEWLCSNTCENNWGMRGLAMIAKGKKHLSERFG